MTHWQFSIRWLLGGLLLTLGLAFPADAQAQAPASDPPRPQANGTEVFRYMLHTANLQPVDDPNWINLPSHLVVVLFGSASLYRIPPEMLDAWLRQGAAILVAADHDPAGWLSRLGLEIRPTAVVADDPAEAWQGRAERVRLRTAGPFLPASSPSGLRELVDNLPEIVVERASIMYYPNSRWAILPPVLAFPEKTRTHLGGKVQPFHFFAVGGFIPNPRRGPGKLIILSNWSPFTNILQVGRTVAGPDNVLFAYQLIEWLKTRNDGSKRVHCLFIENGVIRTDFNVNLLVEEPLPLPPINVLINAVLKRANELIQEKQNADAFNRWFLQGTSVERVSRNLLTLLTIVVVVYGLHRLRKSRYTNDPLVQPLPQDQLQLVLAKKSPVKQRAEEVLDLDNLYDLARDWIGERLSRWGGSPGPARQRPSIVVSDGHWWERWRWRKRVAAAWDLAFGPKPEPIRRWQWTRWLDELNALEQARNAGIWKFVRPWEYA